MDDIKSPRIEAALARAFEQGEHTELFEQLKRASGLPGPRPNFDLARSVGVRLAARGRRATALVDEMFVAEHEFLGIVAAMTFAERAVAGVDAPGAMMRLHDMAGDPRNLVRSGVVVALRSVIARRGEAAIAELASWTDGYLHAHVVIEALADRELLSAIPSPTEVIARLDEAFAVADESPRAAERSQGVRTLRRALPGQIAVLAARFPETIAWLTERAKVERPESREVVEETIRALRKRSLALSEVDRLTGVLTASAKAPRDPSRIVHHTRRRSKGRR